MRVLFWNQDFLPSLGGVEIYTWNIAKALLKKGHEVCIVAGTHGSNEFSERNLDGITIFRFPFYQALSSRDLRLIKLVHDRVIGLKKEYCPDFAHINVTDASPFFYLRTRLKEEPYIAVFHSPLTKLNSRGLLVKQLNEGACVKVAISSFMTIHLAEKLDCSRDDFTIIRNGADEKIFYARPSEIAQAEAPFIFAGRLVREKGLWILLEAMARLREIGEEFKLNIVGSGPDEAALKMEVERLELQDRTHFLGRLSQQQLATAFSNSRALVLPSTFEEPAPLVVMEAAMAGLPIVASNLGGIPEMVECGVTGLLCEPGNPIDLFEKIKALINSSDLQASLTKNARRRSGSVPTIEGMIERYVSIYEQQFIRAH